MQAKVALVFVFNHRYDRNIALLEEIYKRRFSNIFYLVPFYDGDKANVIPVYESSFYFHGYMAQGLKHYFSEEFEHYLFVADDLVLNPAINENNYKQFFNLSSETSFIPEIFELHKLSNNNTLHFENFKASPGNPNKFYWWRIKDVVKYRHEKEGTEIKNEMPPFSEAKAALQKHGFSITPLSYQDVWGGIFPFSIRSHQQRRHLAKYLLHMRSLRKQFHLSYPLVGSYSDLVIVAGASIKKFCKYCGAFAANELFVEFAVPTALLLASENVITELQLDKRGDIYWTYTSESSAHYEGQMQQYHYNLQELLSNFPADKLYIHPIKLSKWKM